MPDIYYTAEGLEKCNREQTDRQRTEKPITEATLIPMDRRVERANTVYHSPNYSIYQTSSEKYCKMLNSDEMDFESFFFLFFSYRNSTELRYGNFLGLVQPL